MTPGRLIAVVGPSGVGKDTVLGALHAAMSGARLVRRVITRDASLGGEEFDAVDVPTFEAMRATGAFCLSWGAHGLFYGIPQDVLTSAKGGQDYFVNLSRKVLEEAHDIFPDLRIINLTADPQVLAERLASRGRETVDEIAARLAREVPSFAGHLNVTTIKNDGPLDETVATALAALQPESA